MGNIKSLSIGTQVNSGQTRYTIEKILGQGGFGITYQVSATIKYGKIEQKARFAMKEHFLNDYCERDNATHIKVSAPAKEKVEESLRDFISEARRLNSLDHPNIVAVNEVFETNDTAYYVMEYIEGKSLREFVKPNGTLGEEEALTVITPILNAVSYLHENHMTHLDIKPDNIMLKPTDDGGFTPILIDFGLSKHYDEKGRPTSTIRIQGCSQGYAPVEQYLGINNFSPTADVYALAATLYYLIVGKDPLIASELYPDVLASSLPSLLSERTRNAICNAMRMTKANRTQTVADFARELGIALDRNAASSVSSESLTREIGKPKPDKKDNSTEIVDPNKPKPSSKKWLMPTLIALGVIAVGVIVWLAVGMFNRSDIDSSSSGVDTSQVQEVDSVLVSEAAVVAPVPDVEVVDEDVDDGYSAAYAEAEGLYNQRKYSECKSKCRTMLNSYPSHRDEINSLIGKCDTAIAAAEQAAAASRLPDNAVDLGLSVLWCDRNVGASSSSGYGNYYAPNKASSAALSMGSGWRLPTQAELEELYNCTWSWTGSGYRVTGPNGNSIYLPVAGYVDGSGLCHAGSKSFLCSSTFADDGCNTIILYFNSDTLRFLSLTSYEHGYEISVRPVCDK